MKLWLKSKKSLPDPYIQKYEIPWDFRIPFQSPHHPSIVFFQVTKEVCVAKVTEGKRKKAV